ncbi:MAG: aldo/keto reductase, partial [Malacoplasma sp.]|nr:aldo/keto reductase [Malacoplasma sp.]
MFNNRMFWKELNNGYKIPSIGFGVYKLNDFLECKSAVKKALEIGYRLIDTAEFYLNEEAVGQAIKESNVKREEIFVTTKVWVNHFGKGKTFQAFETSLKKLGLEYIDMYMIHWPYGKYLDAYKEIEELYNCKKIKAIGVSNCSVKHLKEILKIAKVKPAINQLECNPYCQREDLQEIHHKNKIILESWSPLRRTDNDLY